MLDLEALAQHRGSVLGHLPGQPQPSQKQFDMRVWEQLRSFDPARPVFVESESKKVGNVAVPEMLMSTLRASPCVRVELPLDERVELLLEDYAWFVEKPEFFCERLEALRELRGASVVASWQAKARAGQARDVFRELLERHYDPGYASSTRRNFRQFEAATPVTPADRSPAAMEQAARLVLAA